MSSSTALAIDQAMTHMSEAKVKFVNVKLSVEKQYHSHSEDIEISDSQSAIDSTGTKSFHSVSKSCQSGENRAHPSKPANGCDFKWVRVVLTADPGVRMEDIEDQGPRRRREHRRVPSTVAIEEVKVRRGFCLLALIWHFCRLIY